MATAGAPAHAHARLLGEARVGAALVALAMVLFEPEGTPRAPLLALLFAYCAWALAALRSLRDPLRAPAGWTSRWAAEAGVDMACFGLLIALSGGWESRFAPFMLFPVALVAFQDGVRRALGLALIGAALFTVIGAAVAWPHASLDAFPAGEVLLLALGAVIIARWGQAEATHVHRLAFSNELHSLFHPRNTLKGALSALAETVRAYLRAESCMIVMRDPDSAGWHLYVAEDKPGTGTRSDALEGDLAQSLLDMPAEDAVLFSRRRWPLQGTSIRACDWANLQARPVNAVHVTQLANLLEARSLLSVPLRLRAQTLGRIHVIRRRTRYTLADLQLLAQMVGEAWPMLESMRLADRLALQVAAAERRRISRDLHDGTIQPYIGLKLGLEALRRRLPGAGTIADEVDELITLAGDGIAHLRRYVGRLKGRAQPAHGGLLLPAVRQQVEKFTEYYGIDARVVGDADLAVRAELYDDVINIVREGLSNIRRHTSAEHATVNLQAAAGKLLVEVINDQGPGPTPAQFFPRSIGERAHDRGGRIDVQQRAGGLTAVAVELPL